MTITTYKWSIDEYHLLIESGLLEGKSVELLDGEIVEMSPEREEHSYTNDDVAELLRTKLKGLAKIRESHPITLNNSLSSRASEPEPDIAVVRLPKTIYIEHHPYPEDIYWLIEVRPPRMVQQCASMGGTPRRVLGQNLLTQKPPNATQLSHRVAVRRKRQFLQVGIAAQRTGLGMRTFEVSNKTLSKDLAEKSAIYARNNIQEYWVIDLVNKKLIVHTHPQNNSYSKITEYTDGSISPLAFPDLEIALDQLLLF